MADLCDSFTRQFLAAAAVGALAVTLVGCATPRPTSIDPATTAARFEVRSFDDPGLMSLITDMRGAGPVTWDLDRLTLAAVYFHPDLQLAYGRLAAAQAAIKTAGQRPNPTLTLTPQYTVTPAVPSPWVVGGAVSFLIETFGKRGARMEQARDLGEAARQDVASAAWRVRGKVRVAALDLWIAQQKRDLARRRLAEEEELVAAIERRRSAGGASTLDVARERSTRDQLALAVADADRAIEIAKARLAETIGVPERALEPVALDLADLGAPQAPSLPLAPEVRRQAMVDRADIQSALADYSAADADFRLQLVGRYPNVNLGPAYTFDKGDREPGLTLSAELPIFNRNEGPIAEAAARRKLAVAKVEAVQASVGAALDAAAADYSGANAGLQAAEATLRDEQLRQTRATRQLQAGEIDRPTWLAGELTLRAAESSRLDALAQQRQALGRLEDALQAPVFAPHSFAAPLSAPDQRAVP